MMKNTITTVFLAGITLSSVAMADCPTNLPTDEIIDCINNKGAESSYLDFQDDYTQNFSSSISEQEIAEIAALGEEEC